jgi:hypothetical protein
VALVVVEVEPYVLSAGAGAEVGGGATIAADVGATAPDAGGGGGVRWVRDGTPSDTLEEQCCTELSQPSSSLLPCERGLHNS